MNARKTRLLAVKVMGASRLRVLFDVMLLVRPVVIGRIRCRARQSTPLYGSASAL